MQKFIFDDKSAMGAAAAKHAAKAIRSALESNRAANIILATGASQFEMLAALVQARDIDWSNVTMFHLDEYIGLGITHPAGFRKYLQERFVEQVSPLKAVHFVNGDANDPQQECNRLNQIIADHSIDAAMVGIGENGHLAFNDPPADFETEAPFVVVDLDETCRKQQLGEGWFKTLDDVPRQAISMSIRQIMKSKTLIVTVPDQRKARAVKNALEGPVTNACPASILQNHPHCKIFLDSLAASLLSK
jgi:glucosamine-6-phosphate deaminase